MFLALSEDEQRGYLGLTEEHRQQFLSLATAERSAFLLLPVEQRTPYARMPTPVRDGFLQLSVAHRALLLSLPPEQRGRFLGLSPDRRAFVADVQPDMRSNLLQAPEELFDLFCAADQETVERFFGLPDAQRWSLFKRKYQVLLQEAALSGHDKNWLSVYVMVFIGDACILTTKNKPIERDEAPVWDKAFEIEWQSGTEITVQLWDHNIFTDDELLLERRSADPGAIFGLLDSTLSTLDGKGRSSSVTLMLMDHPAYPGRTLPKRPEPWSLFGTIGNILYWIAIIVVGLFVLAIVVAVVMQVAGVS